MMKKKMKFNDLILNDEENEVLAFLLGKTNSTICKKACSSTSNSCDNNNVAIYPWENDTEVRTEKNIQQNTREISNKLPLCTLHDVNERKEPKILINDGDSDENSMQLQTSIIHRRKPLKKDLPDCTTSCTMAAKNPTTFIKDTRIPIQQLKDICFVVTVALGLAIYTVAILYAAFTDGTVPFPDIRLLHPQHSHQNLSVGIISPTNYSILPYTPIIIQWEITNYPIDLIQHYGNEIFQYQLYVNGTRFVYEIGFFNETNTMRQSFQHILPWKMIQNYGLYSARLEVAITVPGYEAQIIHMQDSVVFHIQPDESIDLAIRQPMNGSVYPSNSSILIEYNWPLTRHIDITQKVMLYIMLDNIFMTKERHVYDDALLLQGLQSGWHTLVLSKYDRKSMNDKKTSKNIVTFQIQDRVNVAT